jgi:DNA-binding response OmpR family regulator
VVWHGFCRAQGPGALIQSVLHQTASAVLATDVTDAQPLRRHILVVEDDSPIRVMLVDLLEDAGYTVNQASDAFQALRHLGEAPPDLVVLDLMLPRMSGWEFLERSRAQLNRANVPVVILSAIKGQGDYPDTLGVAGWFTKPLDVPSFLGAVEALVNPAEPAPPAPAAERPTTPTRVLVVEDDPNIRELLRTHLNGAQCVTDLAADIPEAMRHIRQRRPDLILLDLMLPRQSGWTFLQRRRADKHLAQIPVLVVSAAPQDRLQEAKDLGASAFLSKPFDLDVLSALIRSLVH